jgi:hypothetical protein
MEGRLGLLGDLLHLRCLPRLLGKDFGALHGPLLEFACVPPLFRPGLGDHDRACSPVVPAGFAVRRRTEKTAFHGGEHEDRDPGQAEQEGSG